MWTKTEVVVFRPARSPPINPVITYRGQNITASTWFKYLGLPIHSKTWFKECIDHCAQLGLKAMWATHSRLRDLGINTFSAQLRIFDTMVMPICLYGCQVWAVNHLRFHSVHSVLDNPIQKVVLTFLRSITGSHAHVSRWALLHDFGILPVQATWMRLCARLWNKNINADNILGMVLRSDVCLMQYGNNQCWCAKFLSCMSELGLTQGKSLALLRTCNASTIYSMRFDESQILNLITQAYKDLFSPAHDGNPRDAPTRGAAMCKYLTWFSPQPPTALHHLRFSAPPHLMKLLMQLRLGCARLRCNEHFIPRHTRLCLVCRSNQVEDELHFALECPAYSHLRCHPHWAPLFTNNAANMQAFMNQRDQYKLCHYIYTAFRTRATLLSPAPVVSNLDMFDSDSEDE